MAVRTVHLRLVSESQDGAQCWVPAESWQQRTGPEALSEEREPLAEKEGSKTVYSSGLRNGAQRSVWVSDGTDLGGKDVGAAPKVQGALRPWFWGILESVE